ncbi:MAG: tripartite tricarboxylate transporter TctB family protein [Candidatus Rokuibacteriota bacterium]
MHGRLGVPLVVLAVAGAWAWLARDLPLRGPGGPGPGFMPLVLCAILGLLGGLLVVLAPPAGDREVPGPGWTQAALVLGLLALYVAAAAYLGYFAATLPFVAVAMWWCGSRSPLVVGGVTIGLTLAVWIVLVLLLGVPLPRGRWL